MTVRCTLDPVSDCHSAAYRRDMGWSIIRFKPMSLKCKPVLAAVFVVLLAAPCRVMSQSSHQPDPSPLQVVPGVDVPIIAAAGSLSIMSYVISQETRLDAPVSPTTGRDVNSMDRSAIEFHSSRANTASNVLLSVNIGLPFALNLADVLASVPAGHKAKGYFSDAVVLGEAMVVNAALTSAIKNIFRRPRPWTYDESSTVGDRNALDSTLSFYSGHTSASFTAATSYSYLFMLRHPDSPLVVPCWLATHLMAGATGVTRVLAGRHFWTDVIAGAVAGSATGFLVTYLHLRSRGSKEKTANLRIAPEPLAEGGVLINTFFLLPL